MRISYFRAQNGPFVLNNFSLVQTIMFIYLLAIFIKQNSRKFLTADPELWGCAILGPKLVHLPQTKIFLEKKLDIIFIYLLAPSNAQNFKQILTADPELWGCAIFGAKMAQLCKWEFFSENLFMSLVPFIHAYRHTEKSKSNINLLMRYRRFLAITWEPDLTRFFPSIQFSHNLMNHKNFRFTQIPDKTNDMIFLRSPKILFLGHFWLFLSFLPDDDFFQKIRLLHTTMYGP